MEGTRLGLTRINVVRPGRGTEVEHLLVGSGLLMVACDGEGTMTISATQHPKERHTFLNWARVIFSYQEEED